MSWDDDVQLTGAVGTPDAFRQTYGAAAEKVGAALGVNPNVILGQWGHETAWGKKTVGDYNFGNIKGPGKSAKDSQTGSMDSYRSYKSVDDFAKDYIDLIKTRYPGAVGTGDNPTKFAQALKSAGYAEDKGYVPKVAAASATVAKSAPKDDDWASSVQLSPLKNVSDSDFTSQKPSTQPAQSDPTQAQSDVRGIGLGVRNLLTGAASPVTGIGDLLNTGVNAGIRGVNSLAGTNIPQLGMPSQVTQNALTAAGLPQAQNGMERIVGDVQSGIVGALTGAGLAGRAAGVVASPAVRNTLTQLASNPVQQAAAAGAGAGASGTTRELGGGPMAQFIAGFAGGTVPLTVANLAQSSDRATRNAAALLNKAMDDQSPEQWNQARSMLADADKSKVPLMGPELFKNGRLNDLARQSSGSEKGRNALIGFMDQRNQATEDAARAQVSRFGQNVGTQAASDQAQEAAEKVVRNASSYRTEASSPYYQAQKGSDREALDLDDQLKSLPNKIVDLTDSANSATQVAGKLHQFVNEQINAANKTIRRGLGWAGDKKAQRNFDQADQAKGGVYEAINRARQFRAQIGASQRQLDAAADQLAQKNLPAIQGKVNSFIGKLDDDIRLAGDTPEGKILRDYRSQLAPNGQPIVLPSQLESVYKATRDKTTLGMNATSDERTTAGVLKGHVKDLDNLIKDVSPSIAAGRQIYEQLSKEVVDPLLKSPVGKIAGKGVDAQKESVASRAMSELSGKNATPERIGYLADQLGTVDKQAFPNLVRSYLEDRFNKSFKTQRNGATPSNGYSFRDALEASPQDKANLRTMIQKTAEAQGEDPTATYEGFGRFLDVLDATGRLGAIKPGSERVANAETAGRTAVDFLIDAKTAGAKTLMSKVRDVYRRGAYTKLAKTFTSPYSLREMQDLAHYKPGDPKIAQTVLSILRNGAETQPAQDNGD